MAKCIECGESREVNFYTSNKVRCKACCIKRSVTIYAPRRREKQAKYYKEWYAKNGRNRAGNYRDSILLWEKEHPESVRAKKKVRRAIKNGLLMKPSKCVLCGKGGKINGHHEDYNMPYDVLWVCSSCHKKIHLGINRA